MTQPLGSSFVLPLVEAVPRPIFAVEEGTMRIILSEDEETLRFFRDLADIILGLVDESGYALPDVIVEKKK